MSNIFDAICENNACLPVSQRKIFMGLWHSQTCVTILPISKAVAGMWVRELLLWSKLVSLNPLRIFSRRFWRIEVTPGYDLTGVTGSITCYHTHSDLTRTLEIRIALGYTSCVSLVYACVSLTTLGSQHIGVSLPLPPPPANGMLATHGSLCLSPWLIW